MKQKYIGTLFLFILAIFLLIEILSSLLLKVFLFSFSGTAFLVICFSVLGATITTLLIIYFGDFLNSAQKDNNKIIRLESLSHPLLSQLAKNAPGTYSHSLTVAELAVFAGKKIGIDTTYLRPGGYYHDIGKLHRPDVFLENKKLPAKPRSKKELKATTKTIINHINEGIKLAKEYNLPSEIIDVISQHHGSAGIDSLRNELSKEELSPEYPGPKPLSKEAAVIMLADTIDAKVRGTKFSNEKSLAKTINAEIDKKIQAGQLNLSGLTQADIEKLRPAFLEKIQSLYHNRKFYKNK